MEEPLTKDLGFGISAHLSEDGTLTLTQVCQVPVPDEMVMVGPEETETVTTQIVLPAQATRALLNMLHRPDSRAKIGARILQK